MGVARRQSTTLPSASPDDEDWNNSDVMDETTMTTYTTHDNGRRPFDVHVSAGGTRVHILRNNEATQELVVRFRAERVLVGEDDEFRGNSILIEVPQGGDYIYVGRSIFSFVPVAERATMVSYVSPVDNNDVPYPVATDSDGIVYLLNEGVAIQRRSAAGRDMNDEENPYRRYYDDMLITRDPSTGRGPTGFRDIVAGFMGDEMYTMRYTPSPGKDFDRLMAAFGNAPMTIQTTTGQRTRLDRRAYKELQRAFGQWRGFVPMEIRDTFTGRRLRGDMI